MKFVRSRHNITFGPLALTLILLLTACAGRQFRTNDLYDRLPPVTVDDTAVIPLTAAADELPVDLSIEAAVAAALTNNRDLTVERLEPVKAGTFEMIERAAFDPEVFAEMTYFRETSVDNTVRGEIRQITDRSDTSALGIRKTFATGTRLEAGMYHERERSDDDTFDEQKARLGLTLTQALLNGFGPSVNLTRVRQAGLDRDISLLELKGFTESLVAETEIAYWRYVLARRKIAIFEQSLAVARKQRDEIEAQIAVGLLPRTEVAAARSEVALREQELIDAESQMKARRLALLQLLGADNHAFDRPVNPVSRPDIEVNPVDNPAERLQLAEKARPDLNEARLRLEKNRLETVMTKNGLLPRLDVFMALGRTGYGGNLKAAYEDIDQTDARDFEVGLTFSHILGNRAARGQDRAARASRRQAVEAVANLLSLIQLDVRLAINEVERAGKQVSAGLTTRIFQEQTYEAEKERFDVGASTTLLVAQAQRDLLAARIAEVEAIVNFRIALVRLYLAEGSLLDMRGVRVGSP